MLKRLSLFIILFSLFLPSITIAATAPESTDYQKVVNDINHSGDQLLKNYNAKTGLETMDGFSSLYFDKYEGSGMELAVAAVSPAVNAKTEALFAQLVGYASNGTDAAQLQRTWDTLKMRLATDLNLLQTNTANSFTQAFIQSFSILLREGFEALIIITALLAYLRRSQQADKSSVIFTGVGTALVASVVTAILFSTLFKNLGANREAIEGLVMLIASAVMFYVSYWLFSKRESEKWQQFIKNKMNQALTSSNMFALGLTAFLAVYREGAESILFYQALIIGSKGQTWGIISGFLAACAALVVIYKGIQTASFKIPYRLFFTVTAAFLYYMAFSFIGGGVLELQEAGWIDITPISGLPPLTWLGVFPAWENVGAQLIFLIPTIAALIIWQIRKRRIAIALQTTA